MRKPFLTLGLFVVLGVVGLLAPGLVLAQSGGRATAVALAGGLFTMALAVYIRE